MREAIPSEPSPIKATPAVLVLGLGTLISHGFGLSLVPAMLPRIADELAVGYGVLGAAVATGLVAYSAGALATGWLLDRVPSRTALIGSFAVSGAALLAAGSARSVASLTVAVVVLGFVAPVSWAVTLHVAATTTAPEARAFVMASASGGAALGVLINGLLIRTSESIHSWRTSFVVAAALAVLPIVAGLLVYRRPVPGPRRTPDAARRTFRRVVSRRPGRIVLLACLTAGIAGFPFNVFLTATAIDELGIGALPTAAVWWLIGALGIAAGPILGRIADRTTPLRALLTGAALYLIGMGAFLVSWRYWGLIAAGIGFAFMNYPIWGVVGALAASHFDPPTAVRSISLGLIAASSGGAVGNAVTGRWIEASGSFRGPVMAMIAINAALVAWYVALVAGGGIAANPAHAGAAD